jgi:hypothetical protein
VSLSKISCAKKNSMGYAKKEKNIHAKRHERKKKCMPKSMRKRKEINKDSPYLQIRGTHPKRERFMIQRSTKNIYN